MTAAGAPRAARVAVLLSLACAACDRTREPPAPATQPASTATSTPDDLVSAPENGVRWTLFDGTSDVASSVRAAIARARSQRRTLLVYVGATWCEPCQRFHHAVEQGELDAAFPRLSVLAFDTDRDGEALATAGYAFRLIPLFAIPDADGRASGRQIEGSVKGEGAVAEITPRLRDLVGSGAP